MRRWAPLLALVALLLAPSVARAHPLGNFTVNHLARVAISEDRIEIRWILDKAEIPTFQERALGQEGVLEQVRDQVEGGLRVTVDGRQVPLSAAGPGDIVLPVGEGGLKTTRVELSLSAMVDDPRSVVVRDDTYADRPGWRAIVPLPGEGTLVRTDAPSGDPTGGLRAYPDDLRDRPVDRREASFSVQPGSGTLVAPVAPGGESASTGSSGGGFAGLFASAAAGEGVLAFLLVAALAWGALHALSPGHGKAMVAAYLVGTRGTARHAVALGAIVTATHTVGVFALGLITLLLSSVLLPEDLYPWLGLVSGLLVVVIGAWVLRSRIRHARAQRHGQGQHHDDGQHHGAGHHHHGEGHHEHEHGHGHGQHHHHLPDDLSWRGVLGMGAAAGLVPCPSALVVLLAAVAQQQVALGMALIVVFSLGLAATLTVLGLLVVSARGWGGRLPVPRRIVSALPAASAVVIVAAGGLLTAQAVPQLV
ncbi:MAG: sulfite exporter TauE/SafE family protein [Solirubrobacteraceae bacterium MAG38_C4-C5]|nr:sulfite exporter TauE/SafE family protein [Candidatus Siliceabacter maunaloa]